MEFAWRVNRGTSAPSSLVFHSSVVAADLWHFTSKSDIDAKQSSDTLKTHASARLRELLSRCCRGSQGAQIKLKKTEKWLVSCLMAAVIRRAADDEKVARTQRACLREKRG
jgi:hypothetical protein